MPGNDVMVLLGQGVERPQGPLQPIAYDRSAMNTTLKTGVRLPTELDENLSYFLGYMHGYVYVGRKVSWEAQKAVNLATADAHPEIRTRLIDTIERCFGITPKLEKGTGACTNLAVHSRLMIERLRANGLLKDRAEAVHFPELIFRSPSLVIAAFVTGYFDADGSN